jgi:hypothetical protein
MLVSAGPKMSGRDIRVLHIGRGGRKTDVRCADHCNLDDVKYEGTWDRG